MNITKTLKKSRIKGQELGRALFSYISTNDAPPADFNEASTRLTTAKDKRIYTAYLAAANNLVDGATYRNALTDILSSGGDALRAELDLLAKGGAGVLRQYDVCLRTIRALLELEAYNVIIQRLAEQNNSPELAAMWGYDGYRMTEFEEIDNDYLSFVESLEAKGEGERAEKLRVVYLPIIANVKGNKEEYTRLREGLTMFNDIEEFAAVSVMAHIRRFTRKRGDLKSFKVEGAGK